MQQRFLTKIISDNHNKLLLDLFNEPPSNNERIEILLDRSPCVWDSFKVEGSRNDIVAVIDTKNNAIAGTLACNQKTCYFHGQIHKIFYLSGLKVLKKYQGTRVIALLFKAFTNFCEKEEAKVGFFTVLRENENGLHFFSTPKKYVPESAQIEEIKTYIFKKRILKVRNKKLDVKIKSATEADINSVMDFIANEGKKRAFLPNYSKKELLSGTERLSNFKIEDLLIASNSKEILGILGLWDQSAIRRWKVVEYSKWISFFKPVLNTLARLLNMPVLPVKGKVISYKIFSLVLIKNKDQQIFKLLFNKLIQAHSSKNEHFSISFTKNDDLNAFFKKRTVSFSSVLHISSLKKNFDYRNKINIENLYIEQGGL